MTAQSNTLKSIFAEHSGKVSDKWSIYLTEYDRLFHAYRELPIRLLEIGIQNGGSLEIWSKFFPKAEKLVGCDINPACAQLQFDDQKIAVVVADANTDETQQLILAHSSSFDLIIDDGSHQSGDIVRSFVRYFSCLNDGGLYVAEDLHCSYWQDFEGGIFQPYSSIAFFKRLADIVNYEHWGVDKTRSELLRSFNRKYSTRLDEIILAHIHSIEFVNSMCVIRKAIPTDNVLGGRIIAGEDGLVWAGALQLKGSRCPQPNQSENQWSTRVVPIEEEFVLQVEEIATISQNFVEQKQVQLAQLVQMQQAHEQLMEEQGRQYAEQEQAMLVQLNQVKQEIEKVECENCHLQELLHIQQEHEQLMEEKGIRYREREKLLQGQLFSKQDELGRLARNYSEMIEVQAQGFAQIQKELNAMRLRYSAPINANKGSNNMLINDSSTAEVSLDDLLSFSDERFIDSAYAVILGRAPDQEGRLYYLARVRAGVHRVDILAQLYFSQEGKSRKVNFEWLNKAIKARKLQRGFVFGYLLRFVGIKLGDKDEKIRVVENKFNTLDAQVQQRFLEMDRGFSVLEKFFRQQEQLLLQAGESALLQTAVSRHKAEMNQYEITANTNNLSQSGSDGVVDTITKSSSGIKVSVIILTKNPGSIFREVLLGVLSQETPWLYEVIVVDSGSSDGTIDFVRQYPQVRFLEIKPSEFGHGRTRNLAVSVAKGEYAAMLTHDAKPLNTSWLFNLVRPLDDNSTVAGVFGRHKAYPQHSPYIKRDIELHFNGFLQWPLVMGIEDPERYAREQGYRQVLHFFSDNNACLRKEVWEKIPYPDVNFAEDQLWAKAIVEAGYKRAYADDAVVYHSHNYPLSDVFRRSFDESYALKSLFGYDLCPSVSHGITQIYVGTRFDLMYLRGSVGLINSLGLALKTPLLHVAKQAGWWIGHYQGRFKGVFFLLFSLDDAIKRKVNKTLPQKIQSLIQNKKRNDNSHSIKQSALLEVIANKTDVIGFYDFVLTKDAETIASDFDFGNEMSINWLVPDFGIGSGGHLNIFRFIHMLEKKGYKNTICVVGNHRHTSPFQARAMILEHFFELQAEVVFGVSNLPAAKYSFATSWITAYALKGFGATLHKLYFVQDFEPAFYSWGSEYNFAEATYKFGFTGVCAGSWLSSMLTASYGMKCHSISFSYDRDLYQQTLRREPKKQRVFCYCRPPTIRRGWESAMLALNLVGQKLPNVEFVFAGWDMSNYHFPHPHLNAGVCSLKELPDLYSQCDAALVFSFTNLSLLPLELMACGCVVVSNRAPNTEWLLSDENSILPETSSPEAVADAIVNVLLDTKLRDELVVRAKVFAGSTSWLAEADKLDEVLQNLGRG